MRLEARVGIEPTHEAFAEPCLTTWLPRRIHSRQIIVNASQRKCNSSVEMRRELTQIKRHRGGKPDRRQNGSLTHEKQTPEIGAHAHEQ